MMESPNALTTTDGRFILAATHVDQSRICVKCCNISIDDLRLFLPESYISLIAKLYIGDSKAHLSFEFSVQLAGQQIELDSMCTFKFSDPLQALRNGEHR